MKSKEMRSNLLLLLTAIIWGFAFVAQRVGVQYVGMFTFGGVRFALGGLSLLPLIFYFKRKEKAQEQSIASFRTAILPGILIGTILFTAASLQQAGLYYTAAGKAAFITGLYIVIVPLLGIFLKHRIGANIWIGVLLAVSGLYFLSIRSDFTITRGDLLEIIGAFFWALHILSIDHFSKKIDPLQLSFVQFMTCSTLSMVAALIFEDITLSGIIKAGIPILYGGLLSVGVAYTLQVISQKHAKPSHAAIIMSMESVFATLGGYLLLHEMLDRKSLLGCVLMMAGMIAAQVRFSKK